VVGFGSGLVNFMTVVCLPDLFPFLNDIEDGTINDIDHVVVRVRFVLCCWSLSMTSMES
jgi:hypothetical protein